MIDMIDISKKIANKMLELKFSYADLAKLTGISKSTLQRYVTGETGKMPIPSLELIANALNVSPAFLLGWDEPPAPSPIYTPEEQRLISAWRKATDKERLTIATILSDYGMTLDQVAEEKLSG